VIADLAAAVAGATNRPQMVDNQARHFSTNCHPSLSPLSGVAHGHTPRHRQHEDTELALLPALANRHGLITGATGTGKT
jgi:MoxR-like ATPase